MPMAIACGKHYYITYSTDHASKEKQKKTTKKKPRKGTNKGWLLKNLLRPYLVFLISWSDWTGFSNFWLYPLYLAAVGASPSQWWAPVWIQGRLQYQSMFLACEWGCITLSQERNPMHCDTSGLHQSLWQVQIWHLVQEAAGQEDASHSQNTDLCIRGAACLVGLVLFILFQIFLNKGVYPV